MHVEGNSCTYVKQTSSYVKQKSSYVKQTSSPYVEQTSSPYVNQSSSTYVKQTGSTYVKQTSSTYVKQTSSTIHHNLTVVHFNAQLRNKYTDLGLHSYLTDNDVDICAISETWLCEDISSDEFCPDGYTVIRKDRDISHYDEGTFSMESRGGVLLLAKENLQAQQVSKDVQAELLWATVKPNHEDNLLIGVLYRPEKGALTNIQNICSSINQIQVGDVLLLGDFNFPNINWDNPSPQGQIETIFLDTVEDNLLTQLVSTPTRGKNILDLVFTGNIDMIDSCDVIPPLGSSDHNGTLVKLKTLVTRQSETSRKVYLYSQGNYEDMDIEVCSYNWDTLFSTRRLNQNWELFKNIYSSLVDKHVPYKMVKNNSRHKPPWCNSTAVKRAKRHQRSKWIQARQSQLNADMVLFEDAKQDTRLANLKAKSEYEDRLVKEVGKNPKRFFNYTRHFMRSSSTVEMLLHQGKEVTKDTEKADLLNSHFTSVMTQESELTGSIYIADPQVEQSFYNINITQELVKQKLQKLKPNKSPGIDNIHVNVLRNVPSLSKPLALLFKDSLAFGDMPQDWKDANITPLHKGGQRTEAANFRPVSLTSQVVKVLEKIILDHLWQHIKNHNILHCDQHGFQGGASCLTNLLESLYDWIFNCGENVDVVYLDFCKAFDSVAHQRLLFKLQHYGLGGNILRWIKSFLTGRRQRVVLRNGVSKWSSVASGVPQGSIVGPVLFLLYVNDIPHTVSSSIKLFADDAKLYGKACNESDCRNIQSDLNKLSAWSRDWLLCFNAKKCTVLRIKQCITFDYTLNGVPLSYVTDQKDLGIIVSNSLKPASHIHKIIKTANRKIGMIRRCFTNLTKNKIEILYKSIIRPGLEYASPAWSPWLKKDIDILEKVQKRCLRLAKDPILLPPLQDRRYKMDLVETFKFVKGMYKTPPSYMFQKAQTEALRGHKFKLYKKPTSSELQKQFFSNRVINSWNALPANLVDITTTKAFKSQLRSLPPAQRDN